MLEGTHSLLLTVDTLQSGSDRICRVCIDWRRVNHAVCNGAFLGFFSFFLKRSAWCDPHVPASLVIYVARLHTNKQRNASAI
jgi:hypothetical protein